ncbi:EAL domain-containing protein [Paenibacillus phoenicis]|uniref:EAL domain-containing protein n=1 Tax=Paenibacillus phoenicis TaxID=554117 RepID=A0ABU5PQH2_9BACL|nr:MULTISPECIES: bifunctional diguanylate cyclase/phosphodiesterase [Paenibacillus]EES74118.1 diguanylate cyclase (GGDEF) domain protein [Paenibacillus sp. oral taxon 786 str. D14]MCT2196744.1 EAL domain-containing protein [Paenibacillus sp. p3-SID1389]MEA3572193.1 EAL domain-containing protein [Paenibacillus phoenicis]
MEDDQISSLFRPEFMLTASALLQAIDRMGVGLAITNPNLPDNPLVYVNQGFEKITGYKREEVLNRNLRFLQGKETNKEHLAVIRKAIKEIGAATVTIKNYKKDGSTFWNQFVISPILDAEGHLLYFIGLQFDVTREVEKQQASTEQLRQLSHFDPATHLMSSNYFKELMYAELLSAQAEHTTAAVICINLNRFRLINESHGESKGNELLRQVAERLRRSFPDGTPMCRNFADEFFVLVSNITDPLYIHTLALDLNQALREPYTLSGEAFQVGFGMGISLYPDDGSDIHQLLQHAEMAMKEAKKEALEGPHYYDQYLMDRLKTQITLEKKMIRALAEGEFELHFQPKVNASTKELTGFEALIRWKDPVQGYIPPNSFIPIAEENGFIVELGEWVLREACKANKRWQDAGHPKLPVSVNVSAVQFRHPQFLRTVEQVLNETGLAPQYLELEVTESLLNDHVMIKDTLTALQQKGISLSVDDFGTGYSSIHYLKSLPVQVLKIDRTFVQETPCSERDNSLLRSIIQLGKSLGMTVLAEGVETKAQFEFLQQNGCDQIQGYYYSRPLNAEAIEGLLKSS